MWHYLGTNASAEAVGSLTNKEIGMGFFKKWMGKLFGSQQESFSQKTSKVIEKVKVRARDAKGRFMKDDPNTPENEAWTERERECQAD